MPSVCGFFLKSLNFIFTNVDHPMPPLTLKEFQLFHTKGGGGKTVSSFYKQQLDSLMTTLYATEPHFIRCIVPNNNKMPGQIEAGLVLHQLTCNGVLEGIRICMRGFPNRMPYPDFCSRYAILEPSKVAQVTVLFRHYFKFFLRGYSLMTSRNFGLDDT